MAKNMNQVGFLSKIEWRYLLVFLITGFVLQVIFGKLIPWIISKNTIRVWESILGWDYLLGMLLVWFLMYLVFAFIIYRTVTEYKFLHIVFLVIAAAILSATSLIFIRLIKGQLALNNGLVWLLGNSLVLLAIFVIPLLIAGIIGFFSAKRYSKLIKESTLFMKLSLPIATLISLGSVLLMIYSNAIDTYPKSYFPGFYAILMTAFNIIPYLISKIPFFFFGEMYKNPWLYLWFLIIYYTLFFFWLAFCHMKFKEERKAKWIIFLILPILIHIICAFFAFFLIIFGIAMSG